MARVKIIGPVEHDGKLLEIGKIVDLPDAAAAALIDVGTAEPVSGKAASTSEKSARSSSSPDDAASTSE